MTISKITTTKRKDRDTSMEHILTITRYYTQTRIRTRHILLLLLVFLWRKNTAGLLACLEALDGLGESPPPHAGSLSHSRPSHRHGPASSDCARLGNHPSGRGQGGAGRRGRLLGELFRKVLRTGAMGKDSSSSS